MRRPRRHWPCAIGQRPVKRPFTAGRVHSAVDEHCVRTVELRASIARNGAVSRGWPYIGRVAARSASRTTRTMSGGSAGAAAETTRGALRPTTHGIAAAVVLSICRRERRNSPDEVLRVGAVARGKLTGARRLAHSIRLERRRVARGRVARRLPSAAAHLVCLTAALAGCTRSAERVGDPPGRTTDGRPHVVV